jgi:hypothetical protein
MAAPLAPGIDLAADRARQPCPDVAIAGAARILEDGRHRPIDPLLQAGGVRGEIPGRRRARRSGRIGFVAYVGRLPRACREQQENRQPFHHPLPYRLIRRRKSILFARSAFGRDGPGHRHGGPEHSGRPSLRCMSDNRAASTTAGNALGRGFDDG